MFNTEIRNNGNRIILSHTAGKQLSYLSIKAKTCQTATLPDWSITVCYIYNFYHFVFTNGKKEKMTVETETVKHKEADGALKLSAFHLENVRVKNTLKVLNAFLSLNTRRPQR